MEIITSGVYKTDNNNEEIVMSSPLSGKHLIISAMSNVFNFYVKRNSSGYVVQISGVGGRMLEWLSLYHNFTYSPLQVEEKGFDDVKTGLVGIVLRGECDIVGSIMPTLYRASLVDFTHPAIYNPVYFMIPAAKLSDINLVAPVLPFQTPVWIGIAVAMLFVLSALYLFNYLYFPSSNKGTKIESRNTDEKTNLYHHQKRSTVYVFGILLDQAGQNLNRNLPILFVGAAWCLSALVLINAYTSLLTSYMTAPNPQPLIKSSQELKDRGDIWIVADKDRNPEVILLAAESGILKDLGNKLRANPHSSCKKPSDCVDMVKSSGSHAYVSTRDGFLLKAMLDDFQSTGKCNMELGGNEIFMVQSAWALVKKSPYTSYINHGIMRMRDTGLIAGWSSQFRPKVRQCTEKNRKENNFDRVVQLSLGHLLGAFVALFTGYATSLLVFLIERIVFVFQTKNGEIHIN